VAGVRSDVTELVRREQQLVELNSELDRARGELERLSQTDALTGIANRRRFDAALADECLRVQRHGGPLALLLIDVDHFKPYNDRYGHPAGDECLRRVATALAGCVRRSTDLVARYGGEEFALLLPHSAADAAARLAQRCLAAIDAAALPHADSPHGGRLTITIGASVLAAMHADAAETLLRAADRALYAAKSAGRHRVEIAPAD
jgi:diguanylate cyclase (GGDEF)-like protein